MNLQIHEELDKIEAAHNAAILFAVESGSRAWGFASPDSDFDVRFVYARQAREYLRVRPQRDVIELPITGDLDINGWDLYKALRLFQASNPPLLEWLNSPLVYRGGPILNEWQLLAKAHFSPRRMAYHYASMARRNWVESIAGRDAVSLKKYLYALRPVVCVRWLERQDGPPPTRFQDALEIAELPDPVRAVTDALITRKQAGGERGLAPPEPILNAFLETEITRIAAIAPTLSDPPLDGSLLDELAWRVLEMR